MKKEKLKHDTPSTELTPQVRADRYLKAMHLRFNGMKLKQIAKECGVTYQRVRCWFMKGGPLHERYEVFSKDALALVPGLEIKSVAERIRDEAPKSLDTIVSIRDDKGANHMTRYVTAKDLLDRAGHGPVQKTANIHMVEEMSSDELTRTFQTFLDAAAERMKKAPSSSS